MGLDVTNNDVLRRLRYAFDFNDDTMVRLFRQGGRQASRADISAWLKKDDDEQFIAIGDRDLASFLNGFIVDKRGKRDGATPEPEAVLSNNAILRKLKIALELQADDMLTTFAAGGMTLGKSELSAFFRKPEHKHYRQAKDQVLRNFIKGLQQKHRPGAAQA